MLLLFCKTKRYLATVIGQNQKFINYNSTIRVYQVQGIFMINVSVVSVKGGSI